MSDRTRLDPTTWTLDQVGLDRPGNREIQRDLFYDYADTHLLDTGHFALETHGEEIASRIEGFLGKGT